MQKILIIDDDAIVIFLQQKIIQKCEFHSELHTFRNGKEAMDFLAKEDPEDEFLILLDINMPGMSGWEVLEALKPMEISKNVHVIMVTSSIENSDKQKADGFSYVISFIEKPISADSCNRLKDYPQLKNFFRNRD